MALKLVIPQAARTSAQQRNLKRHAADALRWEPKLQRPYPTQTETKTAYPLKLMRHYPGKTALPQPTLTKPQTNKSPRLSRLLQQFPLADTTATGRAPTTHPALATPLRALAQDLEQTCSAHADLQANMRITRSEHARRLAWRSFSVPGRETHVERGREAMVVSALATDDLAREARGLRNGLPEWKKAWTGRFAGGGGGDGAS